MLGLYLCKKLTELQGGQIRHVTSPGEGASFWFFIEARPASPVGVHRAIPTLNRSIRAPSPHLRVRSGSPTPKGIAPEGTSKTGFSTPGPLNNTASPTSSRPSLTILVVEDNVRSIRSCHTTILTWNSAHQSKVAEPPAPESRYTTFNCAVRSVLIRESQVFRRRRPTTDLKVSSFYDIQLDVDLLHQRYVTLNPVWSIRTRNTHPSCSWIWKCLSCTIQPCLYMSNIR